MFIPEAITILVPELRNKSHSERLKCLNLYSLEQRRFRADLIETYKLISKKTNIDSTHFLGGQETTTPEVTVSSFTSKETDSN